jgi:hypothetical protein
VCGEDPHTSYLFAGLAAQYAYCLEMAGITDSTPALLAEALAAYNWAGENHHIAPEVTVKGATLDDMRMYAAASLFKLTGETAFQDELKALNRVTSEVTSLRDLPGSSRDRRWSQRDAEPGHHQVRHQ